MHSYSSSVTQNVSYSDACYNPLSYGAPLQHRDATSSSVQNVSYPDVRYDLLGLQHRDATQAWGYSYVSQPPHTYPAHTQSGLRPYPQPQGRVEPGVHEPASDRHPAGGQGVADGQDLVVQRVLPGRGSMAGGDEIWISGWNLRTGHIPLYVRFGDAFALAVGVRSPSFGNC